MTERLVVTGGPEGERALARAASLLAAGELVAFPTETVYGLGALGLDPAAVARIFAAKGRPAVNPLILHVPGEEQARALAGSWPDAAHRLAAAFWPGPLTLVVPRAAHVPAIVAAGLPTVAIRAPAHPVARALLERVGAPIAAPSANLYTSVSPTSARHVEKGLSGRIAAILDGGDTPVGIESTVVSLAGDVPVLLRPGSILREEIEAVIGATLAAGPTIAGEDEARASPGLSRRHYAPSVPLEVVPREAIAGAGEEDGVLTRWPRMPGSRAGHVLQLPADPAGYARQLYGGLHALEEAGVSRILVEDVPAEPGWEGVRDRLARAARNDGGPA